MITVHIRKQGGAAIMTIPSDILKILDVEVGEALELDLEEGGFFAHPVRKKRRKHYSLSELLRGTTQKDIIALNAKTKWAREGSAVGRELE